jgi:hypothetical protein
MPTMTIEIASLASVLLDDVLTERSPGADRRA